MASKEQHLNYIKDHGKFKVDCNHVIFSNDELEILEKYGHWFNALISGELEPITELQKEFIRVANGEAVAFSPEEKAWSKYQKRKEIEEKYGESLNIHYHSADDTFYSRDMAKQMKKTMFAEMRNNHRK